MKEATPHFGNFDLAAAPAFMRNRKFIQEIGEWSLSRGTPIDVYTISAILGAAEMFRDGNFTLWTRIEVNQFLGCDLFNWTSINRVLMPDDMPEQLWLFLHFLAESGKLDEESDCLDALLDPLMCYGGLDQYGVRGMQRASGKPRDCECFEPFEGLKHGETK